MRRRLVVLAAVVACGDPPALPPPDGDQPMPPPDPVATVTCAMSQRGIRSPNSSPAFAMLTGDLDGDGRPDFIVPYATTKELGIRLGNTAGLGPETRIPLELHPDLGAVADVNADGKLDVVLSYHLGDNGVTESGLAVLFGRGDGTFDPVVRTALPADDGVAALVIADMNADGSPDLVLTSNNSVVVMANNGAGAFARLATLPADADLRLITPRALATGDLDGDGLPDIVNAVERSVIGRFITYRVCTQLNLGGGAFAPRTCVENAIPFATIVDVAVADFDGDGRLDVATSNAYVQLSLVVFRGLGNGGLGAGTTYDSAGSSGELHALDLDGDARPDLMTLRRDGIAETWLNDGAGAFATPSTFALNATNIGGFAVVDADGDARADVALVSDTELAVVFGLGGGRLDAWRAHVLRTMDALGATIGDLDGDGHLDIAVPNDGTDFGCDPLTGQLVVLFGSGAGTFTEVEIPTSSGCPPTGPLEIGDINGDGLADIVLADDASLAQEGHGGPTGIRALIGQGDRTFSFQTITSNTMDSSPTLADFNGDGRLDLAYSTGRTDTGAMFFPGFAVTLNGAFGTFEFFEVGNARAFAAADIDHDGRTDLVVAQDSNILVMYGMANETFGPAATLPVGLTPVAVALTHLESPDVFDVVTVNRDNKSISVLRGDGKAFEPAVTYFVGSGPRAVAFGDVTGDGRPDIVVASSGGTISVLANGPGRTFDAIGTFALGIAPTDVRFADIDGDQHPELVVADYTHGNGRIVFGPLTCTVTEPP